MMMMMTLLLLLLLVLLTSSLFLLVLSLLLLVLLLVKPGSRDRMEIRLTIVHRTCTVLQIAVNNERASAAMARMTTVTTGLGLLFYNPCSCKVWGLNPEGQCRDSPISVS